MVNFAQFSHSHIVPFAHLLYAIAHIFPYAHEKPFYNRRAPFSFQKCVTILLLRYMKAVRLAMSCAQLSTLTSYCLVLISRWLQSSTVRLSASLSLSLELFFALESIRNPKSITTMQSMIIVENMYSICSYRTIF